MSITDINSDDKKQAFAIGALFASEYISGLGCIDGGREEKKNNVLNSTAFRSTLIKFTTTSPNYTSNFTLHDITHNGVTLSSALTIDEMQEYLAGYLRACGYTGIIENAFFRDDMGRGDDTDLNCRYIFAGVNFYLEKMKCYFGCGFLAQNLKRFTNDYNGLIKEDYCIQVGSSIQVRFGWYDGKGFMMSQDSVAFVYVFKDSNTNNIYSKVGNVCEVDKKENGFIMFNEKCFMFPVANNVVQFGSVGGTYGNINYTKISGEKRTPEYISASGYSTYGKNANPKYFTKNFMQSFNPWGFEESKLNEIGLTLPTLEGADGSFYLLEDCFFVPSLETSSGRNFYKIETLDTEPKYCIIAYLDYGLYKVVDKGTMEF